jgi:hypothetical protein
MSGHLHTLGDLHLGERASGTHWMESKVSLRAGLDDMEVKILDLVGI